LINVLIKPIYILFIDARVQDTLGLEVYGKYFGIFNFAYILYIITDFGIQNYNSITIAKDNNKLKEYLPNILGIKLVLSFVYVVVGVIVGFLIGYDLDMIKVFLLIAINLIFLSFILYLRTNISASGKYRWDSLISVIDKVILIVLLGGILFSSFSESFTIYHYILAQTFAFGVVFLIVLTINFKLAENISIKISLDFAKKIFRKSLPFSLVFILMTLYMKMDGFMLERMLETSVEAGKYAAAFRLYEAFNNIGYLFAVLLLPMFASLINKNDELKNLVHTSHNMIFVIAISALVITIFYRDDAMKLLYPDTYSIEHGEVMGVLMISFFAISLTYIYGTILTAAGKIVVFNWIVLIGVIINLILNLILIPTKGAFGAAIATVFTQYFVLLGQYIASLKLFNIGFNFELFVKRIVFIILVVTISYLIKNQMNQHWLILAIASVILAIISALLVRLVNISDLKR